MIKIMASGKMTERKLAIILFKLIIGLEKNEMHPICIEERAGTEIIHITWPSMPSDIVIEDANEAVAMFFDTKPQHFGEIVHD